MWGGFREIEFGEASLPAPWAAGQSPGPFRQVVGATEGFGAGAGLPGAVRARSVGLIAHLSCCGLL